MDIKERVMRCRVIDKVKKEPVISKKVGLTDVSIFLGKQVGAGNKKTLVKMREEKKYEVISK